VPAEATSEQVHQFCGSCHLYPPPNTFPRSAWRREVKQAYDFFAKSSSLQPDFPSLESVALYYENRAPQTLPILARTASSRSPPTQFERRGFRVPAALGSPGISHVNLVHLFNDRRLDVLVCDAIHDQILVLKPYDASPSLQVLAKGFCCAHA